MHSGVSNNYILDTKCYMLFRDLNESKAVPILKLDCLLNVQFVILNVSDLTHFLITNLCY